MAIFSIEILRLGERNTVLEDVFVPLFYFLVFRTRQSANIADSSIINAVKIRRQSRGGKV